MKVKFHSKSVVLIVTNTMVDTDTGHGAIMVPPKCKELTAKAPRVSLVEFFAAMFVPYLYPSAMISNASSESGFGPLWGSLVFAFTALEISEYLDQWDITSETSTKNRI